MKKALLSVSLLGNLFFLMPLALIAQEAEPTNRQVERERESNTISFGRPTHFRPYDQRGVNMFETLKTDDTSAFTGLKISIGAGFTQQFQNLNHDNPGATANTTTNRLYPLSSGFMTAQANLFTDVQLGRGIRLNLTTYLSSRHHNEAWVKGGYIQFDKLPFRGQLFEDIMSVTTIRIGHYEINYGDAHYRRPDGGHTLQSPFMEGNIMDAFTTEIGGDIFVQKNGFFGMLGLTNGMIKGHVDVVDPATVADQNTKRNPSVILKAGYDNQISEKFRFRLSGSWYGNSNAAGSGLTLYGGDRTGSNYQNVMERAPAGATLPASTSIFASGRFNPGFGRSISAFMINSFVRAAGFEFFGTYESAKGKGRTEILDRKADQFAVEGLYRFGADEKLYVGARYNEVKATPASTAAIAYTNPVKITRAAFAAGWFITRNLLLKAEYVIQKYKDFPAADFRADGRFDGYVIEAAIGF